MVYETLKAFARFGRGPTTEAGGAIAENVMRDLVYKKSDLIEVGTRLIPSETYSMLEKQFEFPSELTADYPVANQGLSSRQKISWSTYNILLEQAQVRFLFADTAILRGIRDETRQKTIRRAGEAMATAVDDNIIDAIEAGINASNTVTVADGSEWNAGGVDADIQQDVKDGWSNIFNNSNITTEEIKSLNLLVPAAVYGEFLENQLIGNVTQTLRSYLGNSDGFGVTNIYPSRHTSLTDAAYLIVNSDETGEYAELKTSVIPMEETQRIFGVGNDFLVKKWFNSVIVPASSSVTTSYRIAKIDNVVA